MQKIIGSTLKTTEDADLSKLSTMRVGGKATLLVEIHSEEELHTFVELNDTELPLLVLGEGSNTLFTGDYEGIVLLNLIKGKEIIKETDEEVTIRVGGGENWHSLIEYEVEQNWAGQENLAYIPGTVGAAPVQNVAAYGQTQEDTFVNLEAIHLKTGEKKIFSKKECEFAYRTSIFKEKHQREFFITHVTYKLKKIDEYSPDFSYYSRYESLQGVLSEIAQEPYTLKDIFNAVVRIRQDKLPDWHEVGTFGSTFVNPFVKVSDLEELQKKFPEIQYYPVDKMQYPDLQDPVFEGVEFVKIPAAWLLEELGWRYQDESGKWVGKSRGNVQISPKHSLCVTVTGPAKGQEVVDFMNEMKDSVKKSTNITLNSEVNII